MLFPTTITITILVSLLPSTLAAPTTIQKRFVGALIRSGRTNTCLTLQPGASVVDGSLLKLGDCGTATKWDINPGSGSVFVTGTKFVLDAGVPQGNHAIAKVWTSIPAAPQQTWYLTADNRIAVSGGTQCLDAGDQGPQTYQCTAGNTNQVWYVETGATPSSSSTAPPTSSSSIPPTSKSQIKWKYDTTTNCLTVGTPPLDGSLITLAKCIDANSPNAKGQLFTKISNGLIQLAGTNLCLDAGLVPVELV